MSEHKTIIDLNDDELRAVAKITREEDFAAFRALVRD